jgi:hypothetical protein
MSDSEDVKLADVDFETIKIDNPDKKAILFVINGKDQWLPRSLIEVDRDDKVVTMPEWLAMERKII